MEIVLKIFIACDHAAYTEKEKLKEHFRQKIDFNDLGAHSSESVNYSEYGLSLGKRVAQENALGIALCGSGIGISIAVNRVRGVRGALCRDTEDAKMCKLHNNANIICFGARRNSLEEIIEMINVWISTEFEGGRHQKRIDILDNK